MTLPSALRGGMGEMLLREFCIKDRDCESCGFESECVVQRIMYSKMDIEPDFMGKGDSVGYVIECDDYRRKVNAGDTMKFNLIIFGKTLVYFSNFIKAFYALGVKGLGINETKYQIVSIDNIFYEPILEGQNINMSNYKIETIGDYVHRRLESLKLDDCVRLHFVTPLTLKYHGEFLKEFKIDAIINAICRRVYILDCFEGIEDVNLYEYKKDMPCMLKQNAEHISIPRHSNRNKQYVNLKGIKRDLYIKDVSDVNVILLLVGELIHLGKNTSFGFGKYELSKCC